jgi:transcriptional regulator with XRE-family HTH domain
MTESSETCLYEEVEDLPNWARAIRERRRQLHKRQTDIDNSGVATARVLGMLERGEKNIEALEARQVSALLSFLEWTPEQFYRETGIKLPGWIAPLRLELQLLRERLNLSHQQMASRLGISEVFERELEAGASEFKNLSVESLEKLFALGAIDLDEGLKRVRNEHKSIPFDAIATRPDFIAFPVFEAASAGSSGGGMIDEIGFIPLSVLRRYGLSESDVRVFKVNGDCMISEAVRVSRKNIAPGDLVAVASSMQPQPDDVVAVWWPKEEKLIIKMWRPDATGAVLYPANANYVAVHVSDDEPVQFVGVVFWRGGAMR